MRKSVTIRNRTVSIWLLAVIIASAIVGIVAATYVYQLVIPGNVVVEQTAPANYEVKAYQDFACTQPLTSIDFGTMKAGTSKYVTIYLKNTGNGTIYKVECKTELPGISSNWQYNGDFKPGDVIACDVPIAILSSAGAGSHSVTVTLKFVA